MQVAARGTNTRCKMSLVDEGRYSAACSPKTIENDFSIQDQDQPSTRGTKPSHFKSRTHCNRKKLNRLYQQQPQGRRRFKQVTDRDPIRVSKIRATARNRRVNEGCKQFHSAIASSRNLR